LAPEKSATDPAELSCIDCDVHCSFPQDWHAELQQYFPEAWQVQLAPAPPGVGGAASIDGYQLPFPAPWYPIPGGGLRRDLMDGTVPGSDPVRAAAELLDRHHIDRAILLPQYLVSIGMYPNPDVASVIAQATNDWVRDKWLSRDERWRGAICIAPQDPQSSVKEIERLAGAPGFVAIMLQPSRLLMGQRHYWPIYEVAQHYRLPIMCHLTQTGVYANELAYPGAPPMHYLDWKACGAMAQYASLASMVANGVFGEFPDLQLMMVECGFGYLPEMVWRMDTFWKSTRELTPWLKEPPSDYVFRNCTFTTQPFFEPHRREHVEQMLDMVHAERTVVFSSDYPHFDFDDPLRIVQEIPQSLRQPILADNARRIFGDRLL
jgi:predicted TIM-barrel fold metal-dependent hydrolase